VNVGTNAVSAMCSKSSVHEAHLAQDDTGIREAVGVFHRAEDALLSSGFHRSQLSLLASETDVVAKLGHIYRRTSDLAADPTVPRTASRRRPSATAREPSSLR
jgi:hypothetical protein